MNLASPWLLESVNIGTLRIVQPTSLASNPLQFSEKQFHIFYQNTDTEQAGLEVTLQACIRKVLVSNLGRDTGYPD
jgi:hypothetical protein